MPHGKRLLEYHNYTCSTYLCGVASQWIFCSFVAFCLNSANSTMSLSRCFVSPWRCRHMEPPLTMHWSHLTATLLQKVATPTSSETLEISRGKWPTVLLLFKKATAKLSWIFYCGPRITWLALLQCRETTWDYEAWGFVNVMTMNSTLGPERRCCSWLKRHWFCHYFIVELSHSMCTELLHNNLGV